MPTEEVRKTEAFQKELNDLYADYVGRPSPLFEARRLSNQIGGARIWLKREDLNHTGAHKINHCLGEALLAKHMGKTKVLAETGAGQHGVALATACALVGIECEIHMGEIDIEQASLRSRERFWDIRVPKIDSIFDNSLVPRSSWSPGVPPQHRKLVAATHRSPI